MFSKLGFLERALVFPIVVKAVMSSDRWQDTIGLSAQYQQAPTCAQPYLLQASTNVSCWSYGCVCSENTNTGSNYKDGLNFVGSCTSGNCKDSQATIEVEEAKNAFMDLCRVPFSDFLVSTVLATATSTFNGTQTSILSITTAPAPAASLTQDFNISDAILIDTPDDAYNALTPCLRFIFNACKSPKDNTHGQPINCNGTVPGDSDIWNGLAADLQCSTAECVCSAQKFSHSLQHAFDKANYFCNINVPTQEHSSPDFQLLGEMLAVFCSSKGFILGTWYLSLIGYKKQNGLDNNAIISLSLGISSFVVSLISVGISIFVEFCWKRKPKTSEKGKEKEATRGEASGGLLETGDKEEDKGSNKSGNGESRKRK